MARGIWFRPPRIPGGTAKVYIVFKDLSGRRCRERIGDDSPEVRRLAKDALRKREADVLTHKYFPERRGQNATFGALCSKYRELWVPNLRSDFARQCLRGIPGELQARQAASITPADLQAFYNLKAQEASSTTANKYLSIVKSVFNRAIEWETSTARTPRARSGASPIPRTGCVSCRKRRCSAF